VNIFVTVGSSGFDNLIREMDKYADRSGDRVVCQIGTAGRYVPRKCRYFRTKLDITVDLEHADVVISHGGGGTIMEALALGKRVIAVANPEMKNRHQDDLVEHLTKEKLIFRGVLGKLEKAITSKKKLKSYEKPECTIHEKLRI
jgi:beta-1,4-N-acetylglucosaminyltransferase